MTDSETCVRERLRRHPWDETIPRLLRHTRSRIRAMVWRGRPGGELPGGQEAEDLVYGSIAKLMDGTRKWDPAREPDLEAHLRDIIGSELNHLAVGFENRRMVGEAALPRLKEEDAPAQPLDRFPSAELPPPDAMAERTNNAEGEAFAKGFLDSVADDAPLKAVAALVMAGETKPAEIARTLGIPVAEVYNTRKRLQRRLTEFMAAWQKRGSEEGGASR